MIIIAIFQYIALSGRKLYFFILPKALSFQDVAIGLSYKGLSARKPSKYKNEIP